MRLPLVFAAILILTAACSTKEDESAVDLTLACQLDECVCVDPERAFYEKPDPQPVLWKENGDAYCPDGLALELAKNLER